MDGKVGRQGGGKAAGVVAEKTGLGEGNEAQYGGRNDCVKKNFEGGVKETGKMRKCRKRGRAERKAYCKNRRETNGNVRWKWGRKAKRMERNRKNRKWSKRSTRRSTLGTFY